MQSAELGGASAGAVAVATAIWLILVALSPAHGQAINLGEVGILLLDPPLRRLRSLHGGQREAVKMDAVFARSRREKAHELSFGGLQRGVGHVVDKSDRQDAIGDVAVTVDFIGLA